jgi:hypothetical protein
MIEKASPFGNSSPLLAEITPAPVMGSAVEAITCQMHREMSRYADRIGKNALVCNQQPSYTGRTRIKRYSFATEMMMEIE